jgi:hypothetical protein
MMESYCGCGWALLTGIVVGVVGLFVILVNLPDPETWD